MIFSAYQILCTLIPVPERLSRYSILRFQKYNIRVNTIFAHYILMENTMIDGLIHTYVDKRGLMRCLPTPCPRCGAHRLTFADTRATSGRS